MYTMQAPQMPMSPTTAPTTMQAPQMPMHPPVTTSSYAGAGGGLPPQANPMAQQQMMARQLRGPGMGAPQMPMQAQGNPMQPQRGRMGQPQMSAGASIARR